MRTHEAAATPSAPRCLWHTLAKDTLPFRCERPQLPGRSTCAQHSAELDLRVFEASHSPKLAWVIYWTAGYRAMRRCEAGVLAEYLLRREPDGSLESGSDRSYMELRVRGKMVAMIKRQEAFK
jgi:hypothetical protein